MTILLILGAFWGFMFLLCLALVTANGRVRLTDEPTKVEIDPAKAPLEHELEPLRDIAVARLQEPPRRPFSRQGKTIFVVDDDPDIVKLISHVLDIEGFDVHSFTDPQEALTEFNARAERPSMVVTDFCMQPMNGLEFISKCRETSPDVKTIVISGMVDEDSLGKLPRETDRFIAKPFKVDSLLRTLNDTLEAARN